MYSCEVLIRRSSTEFLAQQATLYDRLLHGIHTELINNAIYPTKLNFEGNKSVRKDMPYRTKTVR
jgi:hypothetical protein